jgi:hypothetical protein
VFHYQEALQLHRTLDAFKHASLHEAEGMDQSTSNWAFGSSLITAIAICYSAQLTLYDANMCADADDVKGIGIQEQVEMQQIAISGIKDTCLAVHGLATMISKSDELKDWPKSPLTTDCLYQAAMLILCHARETGDNEYVKVVWDIVNAIKTLAGRWNVASNNFAPILAS